MTRLPPAVRLLGIGWYFALSIAGGIIGGVFLDRWLGSTPVFTLLGLLLGLLAAFWGGFFLLMDVIGKGQREKDGDGA